MTFLRGAIAAPFTRPGVELRRYPIAVVLRQVRHAPGLGRAGSSGAWASPSTYWLRLLAGWPASPR